MAISWTPEDETLKYVRRAGLSACLLLLVYVASATALAFFHDRYVPDAWQGGVKAYCTPLHRLVVVTTGYGNG